MSLVDLEKLQSFVTYRLDSAEAFALINVQSLRKLVIDAEVNVATVALTPKSGGTKIGAGIVVGMPTVDSAEADVPGPMAEVELPIRCIEQPTLNRDATTGTQITAEELGIAVLKDLHQIGFMGLVTLYAAKKAMVPTPDKELVAYDVFLRGTLPMSSLVAVNLPGLVSPAQTVTLTDTTGGASVYYTTDESFPASKNGAAILYTVPFTVASGTVVQWAAYKTGMRGSDMGRALIS